MTHYLPTRRSYDRQVWRLFGKILLAWGPGGLACCSCLAQALGNVQRRGLLTCVLRNRPPELVGTVDHKGQVVPQPGHGHEEGLLIGQIALPAIHDGNADPTSAPAPYGH